MSASKKEEEKFQNVNETKLNSRFALYLLSNKKHICASETEETFSSSAVYSSESAESSFCLSLLNGNLSPDLETIVRCHLLKSLPSQDSSDVESDGKYTILKTSDASEENVGCYYHKLLKNFNSGSLKVDPHESSSKYHAFFLCLIGPSNGVMESFCSELGTFCKSLLPLLDPEGIKEDGSLLRISKFQLQSWYYYCIEYISRCVRNFNDQLVQALHCSLWGNVKVSSTVEETLWDLERLIEVCSLMSNCTDNKVIKDSDGLILEVKDKKFLVNKDIGFSQYCAKWYEKLKNCYNEDHLGLRGILESFRLKATQDLNTLKRLIQKAILDHYALFRAYQFLKASGYSDVLLFHVKQEAIVAKDNEMIDVIDCLQDYLKSNSC